MNNEPGSSIPPQPNQQPLVTPQPQAPPQPQPIYPPVPEPQPMVQPAEPIQPTPMQAAPMQTAPTPAAPAQPATNPGIIILQWLTYAFWGWTVLAMSFLTVSVLESFLANADTGSFTPYTIAAVLVLLPISIVCDTIYSKSEPLKKTGAASVVMIIHAVIFALFGIGSLIAAVFSLVTMFTSSSDMSSNEAALISAIIIFFLYGAVFLRTIRPPRFPKIARYFTLFMLCTVGIVSVLGLVGPVAKARATRTDKLIENNLTSVSTSINSYANSNHQLPTDLKSLDLSGDAKKLVTDNLVTYQANTRQPASSSVDNTYYSTGVNQRAASTYYYQLCVNYKKANKDKYSTQYPDTTSDGGYTDYLSAYYHGAGNTCYKMKTTTY